MFIATLETRNFTFEGAGTTRGLAEAALADACIAHARQYKLERDWAADLYESVTVRELVSGAGYRDRELLDITNVPPRSS